MMTRKRIHNKGRKLLAGALSVLLGISLYMSDTPFTAQAADTSAGITDGLAASETDGDNYTVTITLKCGETEADSSIYKALTLKKSDDSETFYQLNEDKAVTLPAGTYLLYLNEKKLPGSELNVTEGMNTNYEVRYWTIRFMNNDQEIGRWLVTDSYVIPQETLDKMFLSQDGYTFMGWTATTDGSTLIDWTLPIAEDLTVYAIWESETPPCEHNYIWNFDEKAHWQVCETCGTILEEENAPHSFGADWAIDGTNHWHTCICGAKSDDGPHTESEWIVDQQATDTADGFRHTECTICQKTMREEVIPKTVPEETHKHQYDAEWKSDETHHWHVCISIEGKCDAPESDKAEHAFNEGKVTKEATEETKGEKLYTCKDCGYKKTEVLPKLEHKHKFSEEWKSDDTSHWHVCACGAKSEVNLHTAGDWITDKKPTTTAEGSRHQECTTCKKILKTETIAKLVAPKITAGVGQIYHPGSGKDLTITCSGSLEDLTGVYVDNGSVHKSNYTAVSGSTILTLKSAYLDSLAGGTHTLKLAYSNGTSAETQFTIQKTAAVKTGDSTNYIPLVILLILSGGVLIVTAVIRKRGFNG